MPPVTSPPPGFLEMLACHLPDASLPSPAIHQLCTYAAVRQRWGLVHNLSGPQALQDIWVTDILDALLLLPALSPSLRLIDVGSGSGVPGLVVAIALPGTAVTLVEPRAKRAAFLRTAVRALDVSSQITVRRARWPIRLTDDVQVVARGVVAPEYWPALAAEGGPQVRRILRMLGPRRVGQCPRPFELAFARSFEVSGLGTRHVEAWTRPKRPKPPASSLL